MEKTMQCQRKIPSKQLRIISNDLLLKLRPECLLSHCQPSILPIDSILAISDTCHFAFPNTSQSTDSPHTIIITQLSICGFVLFYFFPELLLLWFTLESFGSGGRGSSSCICMHNVLLFHIITLHVLIQQLFQPFFRDALIHQNLFLSSRLSCSLTRFSTDLF